MEAVRSKDGNNIDPVYTKYAFKKRPFTAKMMDAEIATRAIENQLNSDYLNYSGGKFKRYNRRK